MTSQRIAAVQLGVRPSRLVLTFILVVWALVAVASDAGAAVVTLGPGDRPGVAVDAAGTSYIAWDGPENPATLRFCRLPRAATACDDGVASTIAIPGESLGRPFVVLNGDRVDVVEFRFGAGNPFQAIFVSTSMDRGVSFGPAHVVGGVPFTDAVPGPGNSVVVAGTSPGGSPTAGTLVQSIALDGPSVGTTGALISPNVYSIGIALLDASTPVVVSSNLSSDGQVRRYDGSGPINDAGNWTAPVEIGKADRAHLAGGPSGVFLMSEAPGLSAPGLSVRKYDGSGFGAPAPLTGGQGARAHVFEDPAGRLHAAFQTLDAVGYHLVYAVSDDGVTWRRGTLAPDTGAGEYLNERVAIAADHIGVVAYQLAGNVQVAAIGPEPPIDPVKAPPAPPPPVAPKPVTKLQPGFKAGTTGSATRSRRRVRIKIHATIVLPAGIATTTGCKGAATITIRSRHTLVTKATVAVGPRCQITLSRTVKRTKIRRAKRLTVRIAFSGNDVLTAATKTTTIKVRR